MRKPQAHDGSRHHHHKRRPDGSLVFAGRDDFRPNLTPEECIRAGIFGGIYFNPIGGKRGIFGRRVDIDHKEFPRSWFSGLDERSYLGRRYDRTLNRYGVVAGKDQAFWESKGWIDPQDPRGWFQWYCRFYMGRRSDDDDRQIARWRGVAGERGRWKRFLANKIGTINRIDDERISPVVRQTLLHWAYRITPNDLRH
jgi:hypothetical protein